MRSIYHFGKVFHSYCFHIHISFHISYTGDNTGCKFANLKPYSAINLICPNPDSSIELKVSLRVTDYSTFAISVYYDPAALNHGFQNALN